MTIARAQYDERPKLNSDISFEGDPGLTKQADAKDADINAIFKRFERTGQLPNMIANEGRYGDFSAVPDYEQAVQIVRTAEEQFLALDVTVRNRFDNDPAKFLGFATDSKNMDELEKMGLLKPEAIAARKAERDLIAENARNAEAAAKAASEKALIDKIKAELNKPA
ncbi:MAG: internal scaffolding protein [Arizlama microvirus]|nr:MAG: internal scaffolding protein [Arizlama microvirus]